MTGFLFGTRLLSGLSVEIFCCNLMPPFKIVGSAFYFRFFLTYFRIREFQEYYSMGMSLFCKMTKNADVHDK